MQRASIFGSTFWIINRVLGSYPRYGKKIYAKDSFPFLLFSERGNKLSTSTVHWNFRIKLYIRREKRGIEETQRMRVEMGKVGGEEGEQDNFRHITYLCIINTITISHKPSRIFFFFNTLLHLTNGSFSLWRNPMSLCRAALSLSLSVYMSASCLSVFLTTAWLAVVRETERAQPLCRL